MKINFALVGLAAAQSGEGKDYEYDYPAASEDRWEFSNGVTFTDFGGKTSGHLTAADYVKALKLSCWNSNMIRDMNNDNKFQLYAKGGTAVAEASQANWKYALGDLATGMNHQYGFEHEQTNEFSADLSTTGTANSMNVNQNTADTDYAQRLAGSTNEFHKWGYNTDGVNRLASDGYVANAVPYHFGHADNLGNSANRPHSYDNTGAMNQPADFLGFKDDWRFSLRMGGCLYEAQEWVYDGTSFSRTGRLTYTGDSDFVADIFAQHSLYPTSGSYFADVHWVHVFNAHIFPHRPTGYIGSDVTNNSASITSTYGNAHPYNDDSTNLRKTERDIEDFNVVIANPTYEGHGFLNFVATYHDHVDYNLRTETGSPEPYAGYRFLSTISGYTNVNDQQTKCNVLRTARNAATGVSRNADARCGSAIYENFGDWYFRPAQTYNYGTAIAKNYWAYIQPKDFDLDTGSLWASYPSGHYEDTVGHRGFSISSFPHNELGQDFRFNIRTLHNMGMGVSNTKQMQLNRGPAPGGNTHPDGVLDLDLAVWSYYMYAVDTIKIAFPEYVARVNHCHFKQHISHPNCQTAGDHDGWQNIIVDGVTMKTSSVNSNDSRHGATRSGTDAQTEQYGFLHGMGADDHSVATLTMDESAFNTLDASHGTGRGATECSAGTHTVADIDYGNTHGVSEHNKPFKPCASWCHSGISGIGDVCGRVLTITNLLKTYDELHMRQYGTIQEVWVQLMYAYQEGFDQGAVTGSTKGAESPFPNMFFSAPEVTGILAYCPLTNHKCRGYYTDENQPYAGAREAVRRVYENGATAVGAANDYHADAVWPSNEDPYVPGRK